MISIVTISISDWQQMQAEELGQSFHDDCSLFLQLFFALSCDYFSALLDSMTKALYTSKKTESNNTYQISNHEQSAFPIQHTVPLHTWNANKVTFFLRRFDCRPFPILDFFGTLVQSGYGFLRFFLQVRAVLCPRTLRCHVDFLRTFLWCLFGAPIRTVLLFRFRVLLVVFGVGIWAIRAGWILAMAQSSASDVFLSPVTLPHHEFISIRLLWATLGGRCGLWLYVWPGRCKMKNIS